MSKLIIYGLGDFAGLVKHYFSTDSDYEVVAYCADRDYVKQETEGGLPVIAFDEVAAKYPAEDFEMFVAVGYSDMRARERMFTRAAIAAYRLANFVHSTASVDPSAKLGVNTLILPGSVVEPFAEIGNNNIIWSSVVISHNATVGEHCFLASKSLVGGYSEIGANSFLGFGATVLQKLCVGRETLVGAHSLVTADTQPHSKMIGAPARSVASHADTGIRIG